MASRKNVDVDDTGMIKAFLARIDRHGKGEQATSATTRPGALPQRGTSSAINNSLELSAPPDAGSTKNRQPNVEILQTAMTPPGNPTGQIPTAVQQGAVPTTQEGSNTGLLRYDAEYLRAHAPLLTRSASGALAHGRIQAVIDGSASEHAEPQVGSPYRNRLPSSDIEEIAGKFSQWCPVLDVKTDKTRASRDPAPTTTSIIGTISESAAQVSVETPICISKMGINDDQIFPADKMDWIPEQPVVADPANFTSSPVSPGVVLPTATTDYRQKMFPDPTSMHGYGTPYQYPIDDEDNLKLSRKQYARMRQDEIDKRIALTNAQRQSNAQTKVEPSTHLQVQAKQSLAIEGEDTSLDGTEPGSRFYQNAMNHGIKVGNPLETSVAKPIQESLVARVGPVHQLKAADVAVKPFEDDLSLSMDIGVGATSRSAQAAPSHNFDPNQQIFFKSWTKPEKRTAPPAAIRRVRLTNLPSTYTASQVASLVFGGPVEEIMFTPGHPSATVMFVHATDCTDYYNITGNGIKLPSEREHIVWVELGDEVDPMSGLSKSQVEGGCTRALRAIGVEEDWTVAGLTKLASGKGGNARKVQGISIKTDRTTGVRTAECCFCSINDAVVFKSFLGRDEEWEACNVIFMRDPCESNPVPPGL